MQCSNNYMLVDCAWINCSDQRCLAEFNAKGKLKYLPSCKDHREIFTKAHNTYKEVGNLTININERILHPSQKLKFLNLKLDVLMLEVKKRLLFTQNIKQSYRDRGHAYYIKHLMNQVKAIMKQIEDLKLAGNSGS